MPCGSLSAAFDKPSDSAAEKRKKRLSVPCLALCVLITWYPLVVGSWGPWTVGLLMYFVAGVGGLAALARGCPVTTVMSCVLPALCVGTMLADWELAADLLPRSWSLMVLVFDGFIVTDVSSHHHSAALAFVLVCMAVERTESLFRFGAYEAATGGGAPASCDCADPPCAGWAGGAFMSFVGMASVLVVDYFLTKGFANGLRRHVSLVDSSARVSGRIAELLSDYAVDEARRLVEESGGVLPEQLLDAFRQLLTNLTQYRPYLPDSLLFHHNDADMISAPSRSGISCAVSVGMPSRGVTHLAPGEAEGRSDVCICFTDIEASTALWEAHPQGMYEGLQTHNSLLRRRLLALSGYEVKTIGDAFMIAFHSVGDGVAFALSVQEELLLQQWSADLLRHDLCALVPQKSRLPLWNGLRVRIGVHCGDVRVETNPVTGRVDYFGSTVNVAARVESELRRGGLTGVTDSVLNALGAERLDSMSVVVLPLGARQLKGVADAVAISVLLPEDLAARQSIMLPSVSVPEPRRSQRVSLFAPEDGSGPTGRLGLQLRSSNVSCVAVRVDLVKLASVDAQLPAVIAGVEHAADVSQGVVLAVLSAVSVITWNASRPCHDHIDRCFRFLRSVQRNVVSAGAHTYQGAAAGGCLHGNVAAGRRRYASVIGGCVEAAAELAEEAQRTGDRALVTEAVGDSGLNEGLVHRAQLWTFGSDVATIWEVDLDTKQEKWASVFARCTTDTVEDFCDDDAAIQDAFERAARAGREEAESILRAAVVSPRSVPVIQHMLGRVKKGTLVVHCSTALWTTYADTPAGQCEQSVNLEAAVPL